MMFRYLLAATLLAASPVAVSSAEGSSAEVSPAEVSPAEASPGATRGQHPSCVFSAELRQRLLELEPDGTGCRDSGCLAAREKEARALLAEYPGQVWAARLVQLYEEKLATEAGAPEALRERYRQAAAAAPDDPTAQYLWGRLEVMADPPGKAGLEKALALDQDHPLARLALAQQLLVAAKPESEAPGAAGELIRSFAASCPSRAYVALQLALQWPEAEVWLPLMASLRSSLAERPPLEQATVSLLLWTFEFKLRPAAEHAALRETIAAELPRIEKLQLTGSPVYWEALRVGSEMTGADPNVIDRRRADFFPCEKASVEIAKADLRQNLGLPADPYQKIEPTPEQRVGLLAGHRKLAELCPHDAMRHVELFVALAGEPQVANEELVAIAEKAEAAMVLQRGRSRSLRPIGITVARMLLERRAGPATALRLIESSRQEFELTRAWRQRPESPPVEDHLKAFFAETDGLLTVLEARALVQLGQPAKAAEALAKAHAVIAAPSMPAGEARKQFAEARQEVLAAAPESPVPPELAPPPSPATEEILFETVTLEFGGELPLDDPRGRPWQKLQLAGKTWLVNLWATWCAPCMAELPHIQKLHEELKGREDVGVLTLNFDSEVGKVQPFLDRKAYTFPVLLAGKSFDAATKEGIPQNWLVDSELKVRRKAIGFDDQDPEGFLALIKAELEALHKKGKS